MDRKRVYARPRRLILVIVLVVVVVASTLWRRFGAHPATSTDLWWAVSPGSPWVGHWVDEPTAPVPFCLGLDSEGRATESPECGAWFAEHPGAHPLCGVQNLGSGAWNPDVILARPSTAAAHLSALMKTRQCTTLIVDFESLRSDSRKKFSDWIQQFKKELGAEMPGLRLSVAVHAKTSDGGSWAGAAAQDWPALCASSDELLIMAYDEHLPPETPPGEIASEDWVHQVLLYGLKTCPASHLRLGLAAYGYDWKSGGIVTEKQFRQDPSFRARPTEVFVETEKRRRIKIKAAETLDIHRFFIWAWGMQ